VLPAWVSLITEYWLEVSFWGEDRLYWFCERVLTKAGIVAIAPFDVIFWSLPLKPFTFMVALGLKPDPEILILPPLYEAAKLDIVGWEIVTFSWEEHEA